MVICAAQIQQLKHSIPKGDKKKKKDVVAQIAVLESELDAKHEQELQVFGDQDLSTTVSYEHILLHDIINVTLCIQS